MRLPAVVFSLALVALSSCTGADASPSTLVITIEHSSFDPAEITVEQGTTVTFVVRNLDPIDHELIIGGRAVQHEHEVGRDRHHHGEVPGEISVPAGSERTTSYTFSRPGSVLFGCHLPGHYSYGMRGVIQVD